MTDERISYLLVLHIHKHKDIVKVAVDPRGDMLMLTTSSLNLRSKGQGRSILGQGRSILYADTHVRISEVGWIFFQDFLLYYR